METPKWTDFESILALGVGPDFLPFPCPADAHGRITELQALLRAARLDLDLAQRQQYLLEENNERLRDENAKLKLLIAKLSKNSANSSKSSSSDIVKPKRNKSQKGKRKIGAQPGHVKHERVPWPTAETDEPHDLVLLACPECAGKVVLTGGEPRILQQLELPEKPVIRHEFRAYPVWCAKCNRIHYMEFPPEILREGLFKPQLTALVGYMKNVCHASFSTIRKFIRDILGEKVSRGYLRKVLAKVSDSLEAPYEELLDRLPLETRLNIDETGHKENGGRFWTWVFKADLYVLFKIDKSRGSGVLIEVLGKEFEGVIGCDYFSAYRKYMGDFNVALQLCLAHLIRDIRFLKTLPDAESRAYGERLLQSVRGLFKVIHRSGNMSPAALATALDEAKKAIMAAALENVPSELDKDGKERKRAVANMVTRFRKHGEAYFQFITTPGMDPTNNVAEQAIRFVVIDRLVTQGTRSVKGRETCERLWTVIATCALQGRSAYNFILEAVKAYFRSEPAPSLLPGIR